MKNKRFKFITIIGLFCSLLSIFLFTGQVNAKEISQFCDYTDPCLTTDQVDSWIENSGIDTSVYDSYYITVVPYFNTLYFDVIFYKYQDMLDKKININELANFTYLVFNTQHYKYSSSLSNSGKFNLSDVNIQYSISNYSLMFKGKTSTTSDQIILAYYSNQNILDSQGNVVLEANVEVIEEEPEEEPITIINKMALLVNDIVIYFNENNIGFYQILIGLFIFNFLVYVICYIIRKF